MKRIIAGILTVLLLCGCTAPSSNQKVTFLAMDTVMTVDAYGKKLPDLEQLVKNLEKKLSVTDPESEISQLNREGSAALSPQPLELFQTALSLCSRTDGALDITIYPVLTAWGFTTENQQVPESDTIAALLPLVDYRNVQVKGSRVQLPAGTMLDLGSVAKGYTGDMLITALKKKGVTSACLNLGGNVQVIGSKPDGSAWQIGVQDPTSEGVVGVLSLRDQAAVTSGAYQRYFVGDDGNTYGHIIDPETGYPARSGLAGVTVVGGSGLLCDGLSTALFVMGLEKATELWKASSDFEAVFILDDGRVAVTEGLRDSFTLVQTSRELTVIAR